MTGFADLLKTRQQQLWSKSVDSAHSSHQCEYELRTRLDGWSRWHCCDLWQRKLSHKLNAKEFAAKCGVDTARLMWYGHDAESIPFAKLPETFVVKLSNGWDGMQVMPMHDGRNVMTGLRMSPADIRSRLRRMLIDANDSDIGILIEDFVGDPRRGLPRDYKFYCFNGRAEFVYVTDRNREQRTLTWYDRNWNPVQDPIHTKFPRGAREPQPPAFAVLLRAADLLAQRYEFPFVRIDLYELGGRAVFGEFTHTPLADRLDLYTPFANLVFGNLWLNVRVDKAS